MVLNPVRAGMVSDAAQWRWSSYSSMLGTVAAPNWLETDWLLGQFGKERFAARQAYSDFVGAGVGLPSLWQRLQGQIYLGRDDFVRELTAGAGESLVVREIPRLQRRPPAFLSLADSIHFGLISSPPCRCRCVFDDKNAVTQTTLAGQVS